MLSWLTRSKPADRVAYRREANAASSPPPAPAPPKPVAGSAPAETPEDLRRYLDSQVAEELNALEAALGPEDLAGDPAFLIQDLRGDVAATIRRPPLAAQQALTACRDPNASLGAILGTFHQDPSLTQSLLRHANSPFYATGGGSVASLNDAAGRVGTTGLYNVLLGSMVEGLLCRPGGLYETMVQQVWTHMVRTAPIARRLGRAVSLPAETCYTLGLLHDLGKLIIFDRLSALRNATRHTLRIPRPVLKEALLRLHGPLGGIAALQWNLDVESARAIAAHPRTAYRRYQDSWADQVGFTIDETPGEQMSQVLAVAEWWDLLTVRHDRPEYEKFWARSGITLPIEECARVLEDRA